MTTAASTDLQPPPAPHADRSAATEAGRPPDQIRQTTILPREGKYWLLASAGLWLTGWLKGINLILLLAYLLVLLWVLNWWVARRALRGTIARRAVRGPIFAGSPVTWEVDVSAASRPVTGWEIV